MRMLLQRAYTVDQGCPASGGLSRPHELHATWVAQSLGHELHHMNLPLPTLLVYHMGSATQAPSVPCGSTLGMCSIAQAPCTCRWDAVCGPFPTPYPPIVRWGTPTAPYPHGYCLRYPGPLSPPSTGSAPWAMLLCPEPRSGSWRRDGEPGDSRSGSSKKEKRGVVPRPGAQGQQFSLSRTTSWTALV